MTTKIADIIVPEVFNKYLSERTAEKSALVKSGIVVPDAQLNILASAGGSLINIPFFKDLTGDDEVLTDSGSLTVGKITTGQDKAALLMRGKAWGANDLAESLSGADPMADIANKVMAYWDRREQATLVSTLKGFVADNIANNSGDHVHNVARTTSGTVAAANRISATAVIDTAALLGDASSEFTAIAMHSVVYTELQKQNLITFEPTNVQDIGWGTYLRKTVIVDDGLPSDTNATSTKVEYTSYLFARGSVARGEGKAPVPVETGRDKLAGEDYMIHRRHFLLHPRGIAFQSATVTGSSPTNAELELAANWSRVYESKNIRIAALITNG